MSRETTQGSSESAAADVAAHATQRLLAGFEAFGSTDLFAQVQRASGLMPAGLLGSAAVSTESLIALMERDFAGVGTLEQTRLIAGPKDYILEDTRFGLRLATGVSPSEETAPDVYTRFCRQVQVQAETLLRDLREGEKLFVHTAGAAETDQSLRRLHRAMSRHGGATLLVVQPSREADMAGKLAWLAPGLMRGWLAPQTTLQAWVTLCRDAEILRRLPLEVAPPAAPARPDSGNDRTFRKESLAPLIARSRTAPLAVVTMAYNEIDFLPLWLRYYGGQVGAENCFVVDHGSNDGSTDRIAPANRLRIPRSPFEDAARTRFVSEFCSSLLTWYRAVIYCDVDEILVADPARWSGLLDLAATTPHEMVTAFGLNVLHWLHREADIKPGMPLLAQRQYGLFASSMCKPLLARRPISWDLGFHSADAPVVFDGLFNFHLAYVDLQTAWRRQAKRRATDYLTDEVARHHREDDATIYTWMENWSNLPTDDGVQFDQGCAGYRAMTERVKASEGSKPDSPFRIDIDIWGDRLLRIPERFRSAF